MQHLWSDLVLGFAMMYSVAAFYNARKIKTPENHGKIFIAIGTTLFSMMLYIAAATIRYFGL